MTQVCLSRYCFAVFVFLTVPLISERPPTDKITFHVYVCLRASGISVWGRRYRRRSASHGGGEGGKGHPGMAVGVPSERRSYWSQTDLEMWACLKVRGHRGTGTGPGFRERDGGTVYLGAESQNRCQSPRTEN